MKPGKTIITAFMIFLISAAARGQSSSFEVNDMFFTNISCDAPDCQNPVPVASFNDLDLGITVWVYYRNYEESKTWRMDWYSPTNVLAYTVSATRGATSNGYSYRCLSRESLLEYGTGKWTVQFYYDGRLAKTVSFDFTKTQPDIWRAEKIYAVPDYTQTDPAYGGFEEGGTNYCAPAAVSNSLMWLANNGYSNLAAKTKDRKKDQYDLILSLGLSYMSTDPTEGTNVDSVITGLHKYLSDKGYKDFQIKYQGWRYHPPDSDTGVTVPDMGWLKNGTEGTGSVWLNVGWYTYDATKDEYARTGGHWVTLVGYGYKGNADYLVIHDPWTCYFKHYVLPVSIKSGTLTGSSNGLPRSAVGFYKLNNGLRISTKGDFGILDGAIFLKMGTAPDQSSTTTITTGTTVTTTSTIRPTTTTVTVTTSTTSSAGPTTSTLPNGLGPSEVLIFPQIAAGGTNPTYRSFLMLTNPNSSAVSGTTVFRDGQGQPMALRVGGGAAVSSLAFQLPARGIQLLTIEGPGATQTGWNLVTADGPIGGVMIYQAVNGTLLQAQASVLPAVPTHKFSISVSQLGMPTDTGLAIVASENQPTQLSLRFISPAGQVIAQGAMTLGANQQIAQFIDQFPLTPAITHTTEGTLEVTASQNVTAVGLVFQDSYRVFSTAPILLLP